MYSLRVINHADLLEDDLRKIIGIKAKSWPYSYEKQVDWINHNLTTKDSHLILYFDDNPVAYLNLIDIELYIDEKKCKALGVGNVCSDEKGKGHGRVLMENLNSLVQNSTKPGLLFCKEKVINFYLKSGWNLVDRSQISVPFDNEGIMAMTYNIRLPYRKIIYDGRSF